MLQLVSFCFFFAQFVAIVLSITAPISSSRSRLSSLQSTKASERTTTECVTQFFDSNSNAQSENLLLPPLHAIRLLGNSALKSAKIPFGKDEAWRYTNLKTLFLQPYAPVLSGPSMTGGVVESTIKTYIDESCIGACLVFIDGFYQPSLSQTSQLPASIVLTALSQISNEQHTTMGISDLLTYVPDANERLRDSFASDVMTNLNSANVCDAAVVYVPAGQKVSVPVQVLFCNSAGPQPRSSYPRLLVRLEEGAELQLKQSYVTISADGRASLSSAAIIEPSMKASKGSTLTTEQTQELLSLAASKENPDKIDEGGAGVLLAGDDDVTTGTASTFVNANTRIVIARNAKLTHMYAQESDAANRHVEVLSVRVQGESSYDVALLQMGGRISRANVHVDLMETGANCSVNGVTLAQAKQSLDLHSSITHDAPQALSRQQQRNVIGDRGEAIFKGRIRIPKHAQLTDSDQLCRTIMLGDRARIIAMPTLEITADNVVCSHGASVADLDENSMFYLASRGIDRQEARKLLLGGFMLELLTGFPMDKASIKRIQRKVENMNPSKVFDGISGQSLMSL